MNATLNTPRVRNASKRNASKADKRAAVASAVDVTIGNTPATPAPVATPAAPVSVATPTPAPVATPAPTADATPTPRQLLADAGKRAADALASEVTRKAILSAVGTVKRADLATDAKLATSRAMERLTRADLKGLARRIDTLADFIALADNTPTADLTGANVSVKVGSVSVAALIHAMADASSKADALAMFASK